MTAYLVEMVEWFGVEGRWSFVDGDGVPFRVIQHVWLTLLAMALAVAIALPPALKLAHDRRAEALASGLVNLGRAIPSFGLIVVFFVLASRVEWIGTRHPPLVIALVALALPPIFTNAYTAIREVDAGIVEASRGMGYTEGQLLREVEVPLASPVIMAGLRIAFLQVIATVAIGAIVTNTGGVGYFIVRGFAQGAAGRGEVLAGAVLLAGLTLAADWAFTRLEKRLVPAGVRDAGRLAEVANRAGPAG
ncbi:MAG: ABC transporter permease [Nitriliruptoraceae bacterium]